MPDDVCVATDGRGRHGRRALRARHGGVDVDWDEDGRRSRGPRGCWWTRTSAWARCGWPSPRRTARPGFEFGAAPPLRASRPSRRARPACGGDVTGGEAVDLRSLVAGRCIVGSAPSCCSTARRDRLARLASGCSPPSRATCWRRAILLASGCEPRREHRARIARLAPRPAERPAGSAASAPGSPRGSASTRCWCASLRVATAAGGAGVAALPARLAADPGAAAAGAAARRRRARGRRGGARTGLLLLSVLLTFRALGIWFSDAIVWPLVLVAAGGALIWRQSGGRAAPAARRPGQGGPRRTPRGRRGRAAGVSRTGVGIALVVAAGLRVPPGHRRARRGARRRCSRVLVVVVVLGVIFAPWMRRLVRSLTEERAERIRSQERAEVAAHLHDSVLQTLALVQRRRRAARGGASRAARSASCAPGSPAAAAPGQAAGCAGARGGGGEVEEATACRWRWSVGDRDLDERGEALVAAAREAMTNAAKFGGGSPVDVYAERPTAALAGVRARPRARLRHSPPCRPTAAACASRSSGRMERHGGRARSRARPARGTEVELVLEATVSRPRVAHRGRPPALPRRRARELEPLLEIGEARGVEEAVEAIAAGGARRRAARRAHARRRRRGGDPPGRRSTRRAPLPGPLGVRRRRGRDRGDPCRRARLRDEDDLRRRARRRRPPGPRGRRGLLAAPGRLRARRVRRPGARSPSRGSTRSPPASARCSSTSRAATCTRRSRSASASPPRRSRRTSRRCCASSSSRAATS